MALAGRFGQKIEFDEFDGRGGWCRVKGTDRVIINERLTPREQIRILAQVLAGYPIEEQSMAPRVRQIIEEAKLELGSKAEPVSPSAPGQKSAEVAVCETAGPQESRAGTNLEPSAASEAPAFSISSEVMGSIEAGRQKQGEEENAPG